VINLGLAGKAGSGKDTVADYLVRQYGFIKYSFSDALYQEVQVAYGLEDQSLLRNRETKDKPSERLILENCLNEEFIAVAVQAIPHNSRRLHLMPLSPRRVLQLWGTQYRRAQDPDYWLTRAAQRINAIRSLFSYPERRPQLFVNTSVRFPNEREWMHTFIDSNVWHIYRDSVEAVSVHESETPLEVLEGERELWNNDTIGRLYGGIDLLLRTNAKFVKIEPMLRTEFPAYEEQPDGTIIPVGPNDRERSTS